MQGGMKCRIVSAFAPLPLAVRNVGGCLLRSAGRCGHRPLRHQKRRFVYHCRGRCPRRPERNRNRPTDTPLAGWKGSRETLVSARFWLLFPHRKSTPPEADPTNSTASPLFVHIAHQNAKILCKFISNTYLHYLAKVMLY